MLRCNPGGFHVANTPMMLSPSRANPALLNHCMKVLNSDEARDEYPALDDGDFMLTAVARVTQLSACWLSKWRQATVTVQHVNVAEGHQAIVGHIDTGGRGSNEK